MVSMHPAAPIATEPPQPSAQPGVPAPVDLPAAVPAPVAAIAQPPQVAAQAVAMTPPAVLPAPGASPGYAAVASPPVAPPVETIPPPMISAPLPIFVVSPPPAPAIRLADAPPPLMSDAPARPPTEKEPEISRLSDDSVEVAMVPVRSAATREFRTEQKPKPFEVPNGVEFNGDLLRQVRMARGLSLAQLSERTRISTRHLENLEGDRYYQLPVTVYLRGILMNLARELGLDGLRVSKSYLAFVEAHRSKY